MARDWYEGDSGQTIYRQLMDGVTPHDLTGATVTWDFYTPAGTRVPKVASLGFGAYPAASGWCYYVVEVGLFAAGTHGDWHCTVKVTLASGEIFYGQFNLSVLAPEQDNV